jgi:predicted dienelactone hydrolase
MSRNWIIAGVAAVCLVLGTVLSHRIEPGVRVEKIMLATNTPALRIFPETPGPHPIVLLAHGNGGSKELLFRFAEALAAAGFDCYSVINCLLLIDGGSLSHLVLAGHER